MGFNARGHWWTSTVEPFEPLRTKLPVVYLSLDIRHSIVVDLHSDSFCFYDCLGSDVVNEYCCDLFDWEVGVLIPRSGVFTILKSSFNKYNTFSGYVAVSGGECDRLHSARGLDSFWWEPGERLRLGGVAVVAFYVAQSCYERRSLVGTLSVRAE